MAPQRCRFIVADTVHGIATEHLDRVFERFFSTRTLSGAVRSCFSRNASLRSIAEGVGCERWKLVSAVRNTLDIDGILGGAEEDHITAHHGQAAIRSDSGRSW